MAFYRVKHDRLPHDAPREYPHFIKYSENDLDLFDSNLVKIDDMPSFWDSIMTVLMSIPEYPMAAQEFFDPSVKTFRIKAYHGPLSETGMRSWLLRRTEEKVVCGFFRYDHDKKMFRWTQMSRAVMKGNQGGRWTTVVPFYGCTELYSPGSSLEAFWPDKVVDEDFRGWQPGSAIVANNFGRSLLVLKMYSKEKYGEFEISKEPVVPEGQQALQIRHKWFQGSE